MAPQAPQPSLNEDKYVALVSGLGVGDDAGDPLKLSLLVDYLVGSLASNEEQTRVSKVSLVLTHSTPSVPTNLLQKQPRIEEAYVTDACHGSNIRFLAALTSATNVQPKAQRLWP